MKPSRLLLATIVSLAISASPILAADWPQWRGPQRTDISQETGLLKSWPETGPKRVWLYDKAGLGYSGPAIVEGKLFTLGTRDNADILLALDAYTGKEIWATKIGDILKNSWGDGSRATPSVDGNMVYALGGQGNLICADRETGKVIWQRKMDEFGGKVPSWGYTESVLVDGDQVVCTPGGSQGAVIALNKKDGKTIWQSKDFTDPAQYSSIIAAHHNEVHQYIQLTMSSIVGLSAKDGKTIWKTDFPGNTAVIPTPIFKDGFVYVTAGYGVGCKQVKINADNSVTEVYMNKVMKNHHGGVILVNDHVYGYSDGPGWVCQNFKTGKEVWAEKGKLRKGAIGYADGMFYCVEEDTGTVVLIEASSKAWKEHGRFKLDPQSTIRSNQGRIWTHPVVANGKLYLRDQDLIYCYDVKK